MVAEHISRCTVTSNPTPCSRPDTRSLVRSGRIKFLPAVVALAKEGCQLSAAALAYRYSAVHSCTILRCPSHASDVLLNATVLPLNIR